MIVEFSLVFWEERGSGFGRINGDRKNGIYVIKWSS